jgi:hypothetical protein
MLLRSAQNDSFDIKSTRTPDRQLSRGREASQSNCPCPLDFPVNVDDKLAGCQGPSRIHPIKGRYVRRAHDDEVFSNEPDQSCSRARIRATMDMKNAVDHPSNMTPLAPSIAPRTRQLFDNVKSP